MEQLQLDLILLVQSFSNPFLDIVAQAITMLAEPVVLASIFCLIYWCVDKQAGRRLLFALCASLCCNGIVKDYVKSPRPIGEEGVSSLRVHTATGYSFPSGHTQSAAVFFTTMALWLRKRWASFVCCALIFLVGLSRIYLGVHYPVDILGGMIFGALTALLIYWIFNTHQVKYATTFCVCLALFAALIGESEDTYKAAAMTVGMLVGNGFEQTYVKFGTKQSFQKLCIRLLVGLLLMGAIYLILKSFLNGHILFDSLRYGVLTFWGIGIYPLLFTKYNF